MSRFCPSWQPWRALAIGALLLCCALGPHLATAADGSTAPAPTPESETMKFLQALVTTVPDLENYKQGDDYCNGWQFVTCNADNTVAVILTGLALTKPSSLPDLPDDVDGAKVAMKSFAANELYNSLVGTLPPSWGRLTQLQTLSVADSYNVEGTLPAAWSAMKEIMWMTLGNNKLSGTLPTEWKVLTKLTRLDLSFNQLSGTLPTDWKDLTALTKLWLDENQLSGTLPTDWKALTALTELWLDDNQLSGTLPTDWKALTALTGLWLSSNQLSGTLPTDWKALTALTQLLLGDNQLSGTLPTDWKALTALIQLWLDNNQLSGTLPAAWSTMTQMRRMQLQKNKFCGCVPKEWKEMTLVTLTVDDNVGGDTCATTNACHMTSSSGSNSRSGSSSSRGNSSTASSSSNESTCVVVNCVLCAPGSTTECSVCDSSYMLTDDSQCASYCDAAHWQSLGSPNGRLMLALLCTSMLWNLI